MRAPLPLDQRENRHLLRYRPERLIACLAADVGFVGLDHLVLAAERPGTAKVSRRLAELGATVVASDFSPKLIELGRQKYPGVEFHVGDVEQLPFPTGSLDGVLLSGVVSDAGQAEKVQRLAASIAKETKDSQVINRMTVATPNQVSLHVRVAEVSLSVMSAIGVNWHKNPVNGTLTFNTTNPTLLPNIAATNEIIIGRMFGQAVNAELDALATEGLVKDLAEPDLVAVNGQTASFLAGGEFPVPVAGSSTSTGGIPTVTVEFKSFGVSLAFTPTILDAHHLSLRVRPEVSALTTNGEVSVPITSSAVVTIPALTVRRADTTVELGSGESFALAGLLQHTAEQDISKVPLLGDIPIIGALFRSNRFQRNETELVIIVTPYLVNPVPTRLAAPTDGLIHPSDPSQVFFR